MNLWAIFLTGLTTGGLTCLAMQGGLLASVIANQKGDELNTLETDKEAKKEVKRQAYIRTMQGQSQLKIDQLDWMPVTMFLVAKLISHTIVGFFLGALGSIITLSLEVRLFFQVFTALFMFATAMNLLEIHPIFRYVVIQPPKFIQRLIRDTTKSRAVFTPALLGFMTIFIPCGMTQAMEVLAINTGSPIYGALIMFTFVLGTSPLFALVGIATAKLSELWNTRFLRLAAFSLLAMTVYSLNGVLTVLDSPLSLQRIGKSITSIGEPPDWYGSAGGAQPAVVIVNGKQQIKIAISSRGYSPTEFTVKAGVPVELQLESNGAYSCATSFTFRKFNVFTQLKPNDSKTIAITPTEKGNFTYSCSMGMYTGVMHVI